MFLFQTALPIVGDMGMLLKVPLLNMQQMLNINSMNYDERNKKKKSFTQKVSFEMHISKTFADFETWHLKPKVFKKPI